MERGTILQDHVTRNPGVIAWQDDSKWPNIKTCWMRHGEIRALRAADKTAQKAVECTGNRRQRPDDMQVSRKTTKNAGSVHVPMGDTGFEPVAKTPGKSQSSAMMGPKVGPSCHDLVQVVAVWDHLRPGTRAAILRLVKSERLAPGTSGDDVAAMLPNLRQHSAGTRHDHLAILEDATKIEDHDEVARP